MFPNRGATEPARSSSSARTLWLSFQLSYPRHAFTSRGISEYLAPLRLGGHGSFQQPILGSHKKPPQQIILDVDATDDPVHGNQEGRFYHGHYGHYCYLPLYIFCEDYLLCARLRRANSDWRRTPC